MEPETKRTNTGLIIGIIAVLAIIGIALAMFAGPKNSAESDTPLSTLDETAPSSMPEPTNDTDLSGTDMTSASASASGSAQDTTTQTGDVKTINVEAGSFYYKPDQISVKKGEKVKIVMKAVDMMHDFNIDELGVKVPITKSGETATAEFTATKAGTFEYYCSVGQHRANGQVGKITVTE